MNLKFRAKTWRLFIFYAVNNLELTFSHMQLNVMIKKGPIKNIKPNCRVPSKVSKSRLVLTNSYLLRAVVPGAQGLGGPRPPQ